MAKELSRSITAKVWFALGTEARKGLVDTAMKQKLYELRVYHPDVTVNLHQFIDDYLDLDRDLLAELAALGFVMEG